MEHAWRIDEGVRLIKDIERYDKREFWRKRILDIEGMNLPDYERPLMHIPSVKKPVILRMKRFLYSLIP